MKGMEPCLVEDQIFRNPKSGYDNDSAAVHTVSVGRLFSASAIFKELLPRKYKTRMRFDFSIFYPIKRRALQRFPFNSESKSDSDPPIFL